MKKFLFFLALIMSMFYISKAGYIIRGITTTVYPSEFRNFTLTFDNGDQPISAGSMYSSSAYGTRKNSIVIVRANTNSADIFPIVLPGDKPDADYNIEVRDFQYDEHNDTYVVCGSRGVGSDIVAFIAVINGDFSSMQFVEYPEADIFFSIWVDIVRTTFQRFPYIACGTKDDRGIIASIYFTNLQSPIFYITNIPYLIIYQHMHPNKKVKLTLKRERYRFTLWVLEFAKFEFPE